jgi:hypothetical protein
MGSKSGTRNECCEELKYDRRLLSGEALRWISKNKGFCDMSYVGVLTGGVGGIPSIRAFRALMADSGVASVFSWGYSTGSSSPALRCLWAVSISWGLNLLTGGFVGAVSIGLALNLSVGDVCSAQSRANLWRLLLVVVSKG